MSTVGATTPCYRVADIRTAEERTAADYGIPLAEQMDNAGHGLAEAAVAMLCCQRGTVWIFCGTGNNGGDGYVAAGELLQRGVAVGVVAVRPDGLAAGSLVKAAADRYRAAGGHLVAAGDDLGPGDIKGSLVVDALLGTGLSRPVAGTYAHLIGLINAVQLPVLACDVPSGVDADSGAIMGQAVSADRTLVMGLAKPACLHAPGAACFGQIELYDIGLPPEVVVSLTPDAGTVPLSGLGAGGGPLGV